MKKRSILTAVLALALVAVIAVGGTLAYLTDDDTQVVNTFTFTQGMEVQLWEPDPRNSTDPAFPIADEKIASGDPQTGWSYTNVVPGQKLIKAPTLSTTTSVDAYVFVKVSGFVKDQMTTTVNTAWTSVEKDDFGNGIFYQKVVVEEGKTDYQLGTLFTEVQIGSEATELKDITIQVYEIQANGIELNAAVTEAETYFNTPATPATDAPAAP